MPGEEATQPMIADAFYEVLRSRGVDRIFGNPGSNELTMLKHLPGDIEYVVALQEGAALSMAEGYAHATGTVGVANLHSSSGAGNAMGNLTNSAAGHAPLFILSGQQSRRYVPYNAMLANVDATKLYEPLVKWSGEALRPEDTPLLAAKAIMLAETAPRGPTYLSVPLDDWSRLADMSTLEHILERRVHGDPTVDDGGVDALRRALRSASAPVLVLGPGADSPRGWAAAVHLAESWGMPVWTAPSPSRANFPTRHERYRGLLPTGLGSIADTLAGHDVILTFGAAVFRYHQYVDGRILPDGAHLVGVTADPDEATRAAAGTLFVGDPADALERLADTPAPSTVPAAVARTIEPAPTLDAPFAAEAIIDAINRGKSSDAIVVLEWTSADALWPRFTFDRAGSYYFPANGGLGWGLPAAIGLAMGSNERPVVALIGDGAMQYTPAALWSAARYEVPVTFVVCQNAEYGALQRFARVMEVPDAPYLDIPGLDIQAISRGYGVEATHIASLDELEEFVREGMSSGTGPRLAVVPQSSTR